MIDPSNFDSMDSRWQDIVVHLQKAGFDVYSPGTKVGECTGEYVVVKNDGTTKHPSFSTDIGLYSVMCYVPQKSYSKLEPFVAAVKSSMAELRPMIKRYGQESPSFYDDNYKAHMVSIEYMNYKKL